MPNSVGMNGAVTNNASESLVENQDAISDEKESHRRHPFPKEDLI